MEAGYRRDAEGPPCDLRGLIDDPFEALRRANGHTALVEIPLAKCRTLHALAFPAAQESDNPYILTARWIRATPSAQALADRSPLAAYFEAVQPTSAADLFGVASEPLSRLEPMGAEFPWQGRGGRMVKLRRLNTAKMHALAKGFALDGLHGWHHYGPVAEEKFTLEFTRTATLVDSIEDRGYQVTVAAHPSRLGETPIRGAVLVNEQGGWRYAVDDGQHRVSVLAALGFTSFSGVVRPQAVYHRSSVEQWPGVIAGDLDAEAARQLFDRVFAGQQPGFVKSTWGPVAERFRQALSDQPGGNSRRSVDPNQPGAV
ncbi:hypothetical protein ECTOBSL9_1552 [Ectothiorhodospira sp. BSL-9]|nr:hypothetical protein ECTOBSL9_1552 [Ectothiorhodospira sp. BSL-9]